VLDPEISITGSNDDASRLPRKYIGTYRSTIDISSGNLYLGPSVLFENQNKFYEVNAGLEVYFRLKSQHDAIPLSIGVYNRFSFIEKNSETGNQQINTSAIIVAITHRGNFATGANPLAYNIGVSVDFPYMGLGMQTGGAYELTLGILIPQRKRTNLKCPFEAF